MNDKLNDKSGDGMEDKAMEEVFGGLRGIEVPRDVRVYLRFIAGYKA